MYLGGLKPAHQTALIAALKRCATKTLRRHPKSSCRFVIAFAEQLLQA
jgi:hypothetical protein